MRNISNIISMIGKSEEDDSVKALLNDLSVTQPLKRPKRGENQVNIEINDQLIELAFTLAESFSHLPNKIMEGELLLTSVFVRPNSLDSNKEKLVELPLGLNMRFSREKAREILGAPVWSSPMFNNDRWVIGDLKVLICFSDDELSVSELIFSINAE
jgi:hypothetical protein